MEYILCAIAMLAIFIAYKIGEYRGSHRWYAKGVAAGKDNLVAATAGALNAANYWEDRARLDEQKVRLVERQALRLIPNHKAGEFRQIVNNILKHQAQYEKRR